jgi:DNA alkylation repair enzyme
VADDPAASRPQPTTPRRRTAPVDAVHRALRAAADPAKAPAMQAYMKSVMPYHGV